MKLHDIVLSALGAMGGLDRLRAIRTYRAELLRAATSGPAATTAITAWRAAGGRIRVEEISPLGQNIRIVNGGAGIRLEGTGGDPPAHAYRLPDGAVAELRREARIAPRNLLAHADDHDLVFAGEDVAPGGAPALAVDFPAESARYLFDPATYLCLALVDGARSRRILFGDYRTIGGIATPFVEHEGAVGSEAAAFTSVYIKVSYNVDLPEDLFAVGD